MRSVLSFSRPRSEGWPHHGPAFSIYLCPLSFWLTLPRGVLSTSWCCPSRPCVVFLACVHVTSLTVPCIISFSRHFACNFCGEAYVPEKIPTSLQQQRVYSKRQSVKVCSMCPSVATHCRQRVHLPMLWSMKRLPLQHDRLLQLVISVEFPAVAVVLLQLRVT